MRRALVVMGHPGPSVEFVSLRLTQSTLAGKDSPESVSV